MTTAAPHIAPTCRVVVDNDFSGDPDGLVALAHHLLSPANRVVAVTSTCLNPQFPSPASSAAAGAALAEELTRMTGTPVPVFAGREGVYDGTGTSAAADAVIAAALADDALPLVLVCGGPLTTVADALAADPSIVGRCTLVWVGGTETDGFEYNRDTDPRAAEFVLGHRDLAVHLFPQETYRQLARLGRRARGRPGHHRRAGPMAVGAVHQPAGLAAGGRRLAAGRQRAAAGHRAGHGVQRVGRPARRARAAPRRRYTQVDTRLVLGDLLARLRLHEAAR
ncbi:nucleoside hydrolase [Klenkia terrae]|uniref:Nucleoside hydrolase n=1 Tax=Klenkia terrae TaxID=1052259 RepID=A0ABU8EBX5_9ACTN|nr:nucleoside hydrolase [Klenkia terrae]SSC25564.1 Inosine/uridine-preferring nucleoside hydrolase [Klenkia terrae]